MVWYVLLIGVVTLERLAGLVVAKRNRTWSCARGGVEFGARHYPAMVALHTGLLAGCLVEVIALHRRFFPLLGWPMLAIVVVAQALRWWCIATLGHQWNTRVIVVANAARVTRGPYRFLPHPNYLAVVAEEVALPFGAHHVDHRTGVLDAQRVAVEDTDQSRKRCPGEPDVIDLLVVGGGPAGLATALHGARAGLEVVVVERRSGPIDKACGEGLMPHTVGQLERLGVQAQGKPFHGVSYRDDHQQVDAPFKCGTGRGVRRTALHGALLQAATSAGVQIVHDEVGEIGQDATSVRAGQRRARYLAAADGLHSPIRRSLGLAQPTAGPRRWGIRRHVQIAPWSEYVEVHWAPGAEAYVTPIADDCVGIAMLTSRRGGFDRHLEEFPALKDCVRGRPHGPDRAAGPLRQRVSSRTAGRVLLVGDAAGYVDALTGEGLGLAFAAAELLVNSVVADRPAAYDLQWRQMSRRYRLLTAALLYASAYTPLRSRIVPAAVALPNVFTRVVNLLAR